MRILSVVALCASSLALAACGGGGGSSLLNASASSQAASLDVCGITCVPGSWIPDDTSTSGSGTTGSGTSGTTGSGGTTNTGGAGTGNTNTGNTASLTTGDRTIILEGSKLKAKMATPGLSVLTVNASPSTAKIQIDTKTTNNAAWPIAKDMEEYTYGSTAIEPAVAIRTLGGAYKEYRALSYNDNGSSADEVLQVWTFGNSYATQYRDLTNGGEAGHQAWSFGGTKTASTAMPTAGSASYNGRYTGTAKTWSWVDPQNGRTVSANNLWRVTGSATATANFATNQFTSDLTPETWIGYATLNGGTGFTVINASNTADVNFNSFMNDQIKLKGTITRSPTTGNAITGTAEMDRAEGWVTNQSVNPFYGAFFGAAPTEVTGAYNLESVSPDPIGGDIGINDDRRGFIQQSGVMHVQ